MCHPALIVVLWYEFIFYLIVLKYYNQLEFLILLSKAKLIVINLILIMNSNNRRFWHTPISPFVLVHVFGTKKPRN